MSAARKPPKPPARQASVTLQSPKLPKRQNYPRNTSERIRGRVHKRWDYASPGTMRAER